MKLNLLRISLLVYCLVSYSCGLSDTSYIRFQENLGKKKIIFVSLDDVRDSITLDGNYVSLHIIFDKDGNARRISIVFLGKEGKNEKINSMKIDDYQDECVGEPVSSFSTQVINNLVSNSGYGKFNSGCVNIVFSGFEANIYKVLDNFEIYVSR